MARTCDCYSPQSSPQRKEGVPFQSQTRTRAAALLDGFWRGRGAPISPHSPPCGLMVPAHGTPTATRSRAVFGRPLVLAYQSTVASVRNGEKALFGVNMMRRAHWASEWFMDGPLTHWSIGTRPLEFLGSWPSKLFCPFFLLGVSVPDTRRPWLLPASGESSRARERARASSLVVLRIKQQLLESRVCVCVCVCFCVCVCVCTAPLSRHLFDGRSLV